MKITHASTLTPCEVVAELTRLARGEREATVALIVYLGEFDARRLYEGAGYSSTFKYCMEVLHLSEDATFNRLELAHAAREHPVILDMLVAGSLSPTTARLLSRHLTRDNHEALLAAASGKSKQGVEKLLAERFPQPDVPPSVRKLRPPKRNPLPITPSALTDPTPPTPALAVSPPSGSGSEDPVLSPPAHGSEVQASAVVPAPVPRPVVRPLAAERYEIRFTAGADTCEKLRRAQDLLGHALPSGDLAQVFDRALTLLVEDLERKKFAATERPRTSRGQSEDSRNIPAAVRRAVAARDRGCCAFVAASGRRCNARRFVEFHHLAPHGVGGKPTVDNIQLRCRAHNRYEAELFYGPSRRYGAGDVVSEGVAVYGRLTETPPVPERVPGRLR